MQPIDTLIDARWIIPVDANDSLLENHSLAIDSGKILEILPQADAETKYKPHTHLRLDEKALIPGLVNAHTHASMSLLRGLADDLPLMTWLNEHIWPAEGQWVNAEFVQDGTEHAIAEMLRSGTTCFNDMYFFPEDTARVASTAGMRASIGMIVIDFPSAWGSGPDEYLEKGLALHDQYQADSLISTVFAPHAPYTVSDEALERIRVLADQLDRPIHMHLHETAHEVSDAFKQNGRRPIARMHELGLLSPSLMAVHMTQLSKDEIELIADSGAHVIHCPESNMKLASGFCPAATLLNVGVNVALGTDGAASNNDLDMLGEMQSAALLGKAVAGDASAIPATQALRMATINGAKALGLDQTIGSLEPGKAADIAAIDLSGIDNQPYYNPVSQIVYASNRDKVSDVWVAGKHLLKDRQLTTLDESDILAKTTQWQAKIAESDRQH